MSKGLECFFLCVMVTVPMVAQFPRSPVEPTSAARGAKVYAANCSRCHGEDARGAANAPDLLRSEAVLRDRRQKLKGVEFGSIFKKLPQHDLSLNEAQLADISQFLTQSINGILRSGYSNTPTELLNGDAKAGEAYFTGAGGCSRCHSATGDLAGVGGKYSPAVLQQRFLFPNAVIGKKQQVQVTVKTPNGKQQTGDLVRIDDFTVTFRDKEGVVHSLNRVTGMKVTTVDPYAGHVELLKKYTDNDIHNLTTYLETLK